MHDPSHHSILDGQAWWIWPWVAWKLAYADWRSRYGFAPPEQQKSRRIVFAFARSTILYAYTIWTNSKCLAAAVALRSILDKDFDFCTSTAQPAELDNLYELATSAPASKAPQETYTYDVVVRPALPEEGILLQVCLLSNHHCQSQCIARSLARFKKEMRAAQWFIRLHARPEAVIADDYSNIVPLTGREGSRGQSTN